MKTTILTPTQLKALYSTALKDDPQLIKPLALQAHAGLREIEVSRLEGDDIDFDERCIFIRPAASKTNRVRVIQNIPEAVWSWLEYCQANDLMAVPNNLQRRRRALFKEAEVPFSRGLFRHSFACHLYEFEKSLCVVSKIMGFLCEREAFRHHIRHSSHQEAKAYFRVTAKSVLTQ